MQPNHLRYCGKYDRQFGEVNEDNRLHGRGIDIWSSGAICIGYFENDLQSTGNYIVILNYGRFDVGEKYKKEGGRGNRGTQYNTDGTEEKYDFEI